MSNLDKTIGEIIDRYPDLDDAGVERMLNARLGTPLATVEKARAIVAKERIDANAPVEALSDYHTVCLALVHSLSGIALSEQSARTASRAAEAKLNAARARSESLEQDVARLTSELRSVDRSAQESRIVDRIREAVAQERARLEAETADMRRLVVEQDREIRDLRASKKRLREALDRLKGEK